jgi:hypothetical protein
VGAAILRTNRATAMRKSVTYFTFTKITLSFIIDVDKKRCLANSAAESLPCKKARFLPNFFLNCAFYGLDTEPEP